MQPLPASTVLTSVKCASDYPGESAQPRQVQQLADEYRKAAVLLHGHGHRRSPLSWAPCRQTAIHAIELYLNALLLSTTCTAARVRGFQHNLDRRIEAAAAAGLKLRMRTVLHLRNMSSSREYLITRYGPEMASSHSQINRLMATLDEVANKVTKLIAHLAQTGSGPGAPKIIVGISESSAVLSERPGLSKPTRKNGLHTHTGVAPRGR